MTVENRRLVGVCIGIVVGAICSYLLVEAEVVRALPSYEGLTNLGTTAVGLIATAMVGGLIAGRQKI